MFTQKGNHGNTGQAITTDDVNEHDGTTDANHATGAAHAHINGRSW